MVGTESCDDGGTGCDATCSGPKVGYICNGGSPTAATVCETDCGDGNKFGSEACDDGGVEPDDGCSDTCTTETGWTCDGLSPTTCFPVCGSSTTHSPETCDDGSDDGKGCESGCIGVADGWECTGTAPGIFDCVVKCGDGKVITPDEECDEANTDPDDGCDDKCMEEAGWICDGASPTVCKEDLSDGTIVGDEVCDDGNPTDGKGCTADG